MSEVMSVQLPRDAIERAVAAVKMKPETVGTCGRSNAAVKSAVVRLRDRHHQIARFVAMKVDRDRICKVMGMTRTRLDMLIDQTPAFAELVIYYEARKLPEQHATTEEYIDLLERNMIAAELEIADRLAEDSEKLSVSELHKIARDSADRLGFSKHSVNLNVNVTLKDRLEGLRRRSRTAPAGAGSGGGDVGDARRSAPPLLDLKANPVQAASREHPSSDRPQAVAHSQPAASDPDAPMSREQVLAVHRAALENRRNTTRMEPAPDREPIKRRI